MEGEFAFIARRLRPLATAPGALGLATTRRCSTRARACSWC